MSIRSLTIGATVSGLLTLAIVSIFFAFSWWVVALAFPHRCGHIPADRVAGRALEVGMSTPEVRLSPDGRTVAIRKKVAFGREWEASDGGRYFDEQVSDWTPLLPLSNEDSAEPVDVFLPGGRYYGRWITVSDHNVTLSCSCGYTSGVEELPPVLDRAADELHRGH